MPSYSIYDKGPSSLGTSVKPGTQDTLFLLIRSFPNTKGLSGHKPVMVSVGAISPTLRSRLKLPEPTGDTSQVQVAGEPILGKCWSVLLLCWPVPFGYKPSLDVCCCGKAWSLKLRIKSEFRLFHSEWLWTSCRTYLSLGVITALVFLRKSEFHKQGSVHALSEVHWHILNKNTNFKLNPLSVRYFLHYECDGFTINTTKVVGAPPCGIIASFFLLKIKLFLMVLNWRRKWQPTPVFLPGQFHGQRSQAGYSPWGHKQSDRTEWLTLRVLNNWWWTPTTFFIQLISAL